MIRAGIAILVFAGAATLLCPPAASQGEDAPDPGRMYAKQCASCHTVPDAGLAWDRVWIDQIRETT